MSEKHKVRLKDIAKATDLSVATISMVLNNRPNSRIAEETRRQVLNTAEEMGYDFNRQKNKPSNGLKRLFMLTEELTFNPIALDMLDGVQAAAEEAGYSLYLAMDALKNGDGQLMEQLRQEQPQGVIIASAYTREIELPPALRQWNAVLLNCWDPESPFPAIMPDDMTGARRAVRDLIDRGHRNIACITCDLAMVSFRDRVEGWRQAHTEAGLPVPEHLLFSHSHDVLMGQQAVEQMLERGTKPDAIFCAFNDRAALGVYLALAKAGLKVPEDVSVVGYDNSSFAAQVQPGLSSVSLPHEEMGRQAVSLLFSSFRTASSSRILVESSLVSRESVRDRVVA